MIKKIIRYLITFIYKIYLKRKNIHIKSDIVITKSTLFRGNNKIGKKCFIPNTEIGFATYLGNNISLPNTKIGKYCSIAQNVKLLPYTHPSKDFVSTHPAFFSLLKQAGFTYTDRQLFEETLFLDKENNIFLNIGNDVWIGEDVKIIGGIEIGDGAIIAAGSIVTKNVEPFSIVGGVPAKLIRYRFTNNEIEILKKLKWWDKDESWILGNFSYFENIKMFYNLKL